MESKRLDIEILDASYYVDLFQYYQKDEVTKYLSIDSLKDINDAFALFDKLYLNEESYVLIHKQSDQVIGDISIYYQDDCYYLSYCLDSLYWHHGYMIEALQVLLPLVLNKYRCLYASCMKINTSSIKLLEALGFELIEEKEILLYQKKKGS